MSESEITITINKDATPVLVTGDPAVVAAVLDALDGVLRGSARRRVLQLAREHEVPGLRRDLDAGPARPPTTPSPAGDGE